MLAPKLAPKLAAAAMGLAAAGAVLAVQTTPVQVGAPSRAWQRLVLGTTASGVLHERAVVRWPGLRRDAPLDVWVRADVPAGRTVTLGAAVDRGDLQRARLDAATPGVWRVPAAPTPGLRLDLVVQPGAPVRLRDVRVRFASGPPWRSALLAGLLVSAATLALARRFGGGLALALGAFLAACLALASTPLLLWWTIESPASWLRLAAPLLGLLGSGTWAWRTGDARRFGFGAALVVAAVFGAWVRLYFLPSHGSWDVEYWKACALRSTSHGVTHVYGDPESVPPGHFWPQLRGEEPQWQLEALGQSFVIDQPPGIQALWAASWWAVRHAAPGMDRAEALNVAAKLPATLGDVLAVAVLLVASRARPRLAAGLAALYWALPVSWLSSAVLGFFDGAPAPLAAAALVAAGRGRAATAGLLLALAALLKATALLMAPAVAVALWASRASLSRAAAAGTLVVALALVPFVLADTLAPAAIHIYRIIFQERLSGGFANPWWLASAWAAASQPGFEWSGKVPFVRIEALPFPVRPLGTLAMVLVVGYVAWHLRRHASARAAALAGFALVFGYGMVAVGVHENHPHLFVLALVATGLSSTRLRLVAAAVFTTYTLNMLALSGLGRFYGQRYMALEPLVKLVESVRLAPGFDLTLLLAVVNIAAWIVLLRGLPAELAGLARPDRQAGDGAR